MAGALGTVIGTGLGRGLAGDSHRTWGHVVGKNRWIMSGVVARSGSAFWAGCRTTGSNSIIIGK